MIMYFHASGIFLIMGSSDKLLVTLQSPSGRNAYMDLYITVVHTILLFYSLYFSTPQLFSKEDVLSSIRVSGEQPG